MRNPGHTSLGMVGAKFTDIAAAALAAGSQTFPSRFLPGTATMAQRETNGGAAGFLAFANQVNGENGSIDVVSTNGADVGQVHIYTIACLTGTDWAGAGHDEGAISHACGVGGTGLGGAEAGIWTGVVTLGAGGTADILPRPRPLSNNMFLKLDRLTVAGTPGFLSHSTLAGDPISVAVVSSDAADRSVVRWTLFDPQAIQGRIPTALGAALQVPAMVVGTGALVGGTVTVAEPNVSNAGTGSRLFVQRTAVGGTPGHIFAPSALVNGVSFDVSSTNVLDTSTFRYAIFNPRLFG